MSGAIYDVLMGIGMVVLVLVMIDGWRRGDRLGKRANRWLDRE